MKPVKKVLVLTILSAFGVACGSGHRGIPPPPSSRVVLVLEENHSFSDVIGNSGMPYLNGLASRYAVGTQYFADAHPSLPNYFILTAGPP